MVLWSRFKWDVEQTAHYQSHSIVVQCTCRVITIKGDPGLYILCNMAPELGHSSTAGGVARCLLPAGTPSSRGQRCCPSSAWWGPAGGGHDTVSPTAKGYNWALLSWQPCSTDSGPPPPACGREEIERVRAAKMQSKSRGEGKRGRKGEGLPELRGLRGHCELHGLYVSINGGTLWQVAPPVQSKGQNVSHLKLTLGIVNQSTYLPQSRGWGKCVFACNTSTTTGFGFTDLGSVPHVNMNE